MRIRPIFAIFLVLVCGFWGFKSQVLTSPRSSVVKPAGFIVHKNHVSSKEEIFERYTSQFRLSPDRRFLKAVSLLNQFFAGEKSEDATAAWNQGQWSITFRGRSLGKLPEFANYPDYMKLLTEFASTLNQSHRITLDKQFAADVVQEEKLKNNFFDSSLIAVLQEANQSWVKGHHTQAVLKNAARGLVYLTLQSWDKMGIGQEVPSQAWAILAAYQALSGEILFQEEVLLAERLSYSRYAKILSDRLPAGDSVREFMSGNSVALGQMTDQELARYLFLKDLVNSDRFDEAVSVLRERFPRATQSLAALEILMDENNFAINRYLANFVPMIILTKLSEITGTSTDDTYKEFLAMILAGYTDKFSSDLVLSIRKMLGVDKSGKIKRLNDQLALLQEKINGPFLTTSVISAFYESFFYSGLYAQGIYYFDQLSSEDMVNLYKAEISGANGATADQFSKWYDILASIKSGEMGLDEVINRASEFTETSPVLFARLINETSDMASFGEPRLMALVRELCPKLDSRPRNMLTLGGYAYDKLLDLPLAERLITKAIELSPRGNDSYRVWLAYYYKDAESLKDFAKDASLSSSHRVLALDYLLKISGINTIKDQYGALFQEFSHNFSVAYGFARLLIQSGDYAQGRSVAQKWLDQDRLTLGLERTAMAEFIAESYLKEGLYEEGYQYIEPHIGGQKGQAFIVAISLLNKLSRDQEAQALLAQARARYPDSVYLLSLGLKMAWEKGNNQEAARMILSWKRPLNYADWRWKIGAVFTEVFKDKPNSSGVQAFTELVAAGFDLTKLTNIPAMVHQSGNNDLAFALISQIKAPGLQALEVLTSGYSFLKKAQGDEKAKAWLLGSVPQDMRNPLSMFLYASGHYDMLWEMIENPELSYGGDFVWLLRTAALLRTHQQDENYRAQILAYYKKNSVSFYDKIGRYLLDLEDAKVIIDAVGNELDKMVEYSYYFGVKAESQRKYFEASTWYHIAVETGMIKEGEYRWAYYRLWDWMTRGQPLRE